MSGTDGISYFIRDGSVLPPAGIQASAAVSEQGINVMIAAAVMRF